MDMSVKKRPPEEMLARYRSTYERRGCEIRRRLHGIGSLYQEREEGWLVISREKIERIDVSLVLGVNQLKMAFRPIVKAYMEYNVSRGELPDLLYDAREIWQLSQQIETQLCKMDKPIFIGYKGFHLSDWFYDPIWDAVDEILYGEG